jgi:hypothetical protein
MSIRIRCIALVSTLRGAGRFLSVGGCMLAIACVATVAPAADPGQFSEAERQLFVRPHLTALSTPTRLHYVYRQTGSMEPEVIDHASLTLTIQDNVRNAAVEYLGGDRRLELPSIDYVEQNPIILYFLERDVRQLNARTGGPISFFRNRIRAALAGAATLRQTQIDYDGRRLNGVEIQIVPYADDPRRSRFERFADRFYVMVLSPDIPGEVFQLRAETPESGRTEVGDIFHREVLTFERQEHGG